MGENSATGRTSCVLFFTESLDTVYRRAGPQFNKIVIILQLTFNIFYAIIRESKGGLRMKRAEYKKHDELAAWDLNKGCRKYVNQDSPANRRLKKRLRRQARKRLKEAYKDECVH